MRTIGRLISLGILDSQGSAPKLQVAIFVDGKNLVTSYESMVADKSIPKESVEIFHSKNLYLWTPINFQMSLALPVANYYLLTHSNDNNGKIEDSIKSFPVGVGISENNCFVPKLIVGKKKVSNEETLTEEINADIRECLASTNIQIIILFSGNGDFLPVVQEAKSAGKRVIINAFSKGLSETFVQENIEVRLLDNAFFEEVKI